LGLFKASVGGTIIEAWSPPDVMASCGVNHSAAHISSGCNSQKNSDLYLGMVKPAAPFVFTAAFWYSILILCTLYAYSILCTLCAYS
jgi:hypothetical protein